MFEWIVTGYKLKLVNRSEPNPKFPQKNDKMYGRGRRGGKRICCWTCTCRSTDYGILKGETHRRANGKQRLSQTSIAIHFIIFIFLASLLLILLPRKLIPSKALNPSPSLSIHISNSNVPPWPPPTDVPLATPLPIKTELKKTFYKNLRFPAQRFLIDKKHSVAYCPIYKNLSSKFKELIWWLINPKPWIKDMDPKTSTMPPKKGPRDIIICTDLEIDKNSMHLVFHLTSLPGLPLFLGTIC